RIDIIEKVVKTLTSQQVEISIKRNEIEAYLTIPIHDDKTRNSDKQSQDSIYQSNAPINSLQDIEDETNIQHLDDKELSEEGKDDGQEQKKKMKEMNVMDVHLMKYIRLLKNFNEKEIMKMY
uniref:Uncharacterized protein n=1 Tax=Cucumis melo TaxID=3656 RepID=A0A9I9EDI9_CUCME